MAVANQHIRVLWGTLAPESAVSKAKANGFFRGPARVFEGEMAAFNAVLAGEVEKGCVVVIKNEGPAGAPGILRSRVENDPINTIRSLPQPPHGRIVVDVWFLSSCMMGKGKRFPEKNDLSPAFLIECWCLGGLGNGVLMVVGVQSSMWRLCLCAMNILSKSKTIRNLLL